MHRSAVDDRYENFCLAQVCNFWFGVILDNILCYEVPLKLSLFVKPAFSWKTRWRKTN